MDGIDWYSDERATFGDRVAAAREVVGLDEAELARRLGVRVETVRRWEGDLDEPRANRLQMLAGLLGVSLTWLMTGAGEDPGLPAASGNEEVAAILSEMRQVRSEMAGAAERLGRLEKRLRGAIGG
jgi:transcriptional regulator with XRE-family HTH domain